MTAAELRARLTAIAAEPPPHQVVHGNDVLETLDRAPVPAAVLVPVVLGSTPGILLTKRNAHLNRHAGQVSFPGGRIDFGENAEAAALREAEEEIALDRAHVEVLGRMADYMTGTGYRITPVLGLLPSGLEYRPAPDEVDAVFELPIYVLLDPDAPKRQRHHVGGVWREYWVWPHPDHYIWGATAAILKHLAERLRESPARMLRLVELALFITPFAAFVIWRFVALDGGPPMRVVVGAACVLAVLAAMLAWLSQDDALPPGASYEPPRLEGGKIIAGHAAPR